MKGFWNIPNVILLLLSVVVVNSFVLVANFSYMILPVILAFIVINVLAGFWGNKIKNLRLKTCYHGGTLLCIFSLSVIFSAVYHVVLAFYLFPENYMTVIWSALVCVGTEAVIFGNGIISVYCTSVQLGIRQRGIGIICGPIPIAHLFALNSIIATVMREVDFECEKEQLNKERKTLHICKTKYPILLVHGVFFRDSKHLNYWGRIPVELEKNGAIIFYGEHESASSVEESAAEIADRIKCITEQTGAEKVNIIAHSKGGLDCRYALVHNEIASHVASLTTINTPHRGCEFTEYLLKKGPTAMKNKIARAYNASAKKLGDKNPDFLSALMDLTSSVCKKRDEELNVSKEVLCQSVGSRLNCATNGKFPLNFSYHLVKHFNGSNDGLVSENSFEWGENYRYLTVEGKRGISHADMIDLNRENIPEFDVREFYVNLVGDLKNRGL